MKSVKELIDLDPADCIIKWRLTEMCNINCSYCIRGWRKGRSVNKDALQEREERLCEVAERLSELLSKTAFENIKIDLIGGEVTIFNLERILGHLLTDKITKIQVTTNLIREADYYISLARFLKSKGVLFTVTGSFHYEFQSFEKYFEKILKIQNEVYSITCEIVSNENNQDLCKRFYEYCESCNLNYMIEADLRNKSADARSKGLFAAGKKPFEIPRYKVIFTDGTSKFYKTRNSFLIDNSVKENFELKYMNTKGYLCTNSTNFFYLDFDTVHGRTEKSNLCSNLIPIEDFKFLPPKRCPIEYCTLCGHMSLSKD